MLMIMMMMMIKMNFDPSLSSLRTSHLTLTTIFYDTIKKQKHKKNGRSSRYVMNIYWHVHKNCIITTTITLVDDHLVIADWSIHYTQAKELSNSTKSGHI